MILGQTASRVEPIPVPLQNVDYEGIVTAGTAYLTIHQMYVNSFQENLEARYLFPAPASGAIAGFRFRIGSSMRSAELKPRQEAVAQYEEAVVEGHAAGLLEQERADLFTASLGNIPPGETAEIWVQVVLGLEIWSERLRLKIPTYVFPRYVPKDPLRVPDASRIVTDYVEDPGYRASLNLRIDLGYAVEVSSPSHPIGWRSEDDGTRGNVQFLDGPTPLDQDIVLLFVPQKRELERGSRLQIRVGPRELGDGCRPAALTLLPDLPERESHLGPRRARVLFVLDRSGSMQFRSLAAATQLLSSLLQELRAGDEFELLTFNDEPSTLFGRLTPFSSASHDVARSFLQNLEASGGTELGLALSLAARFFPEVDRMVLLTDAQVGHEAEILRTWSQSNVRKLPPQIFAIGVGANVASGLLEQLARETSGWVGELHPNESPKDLVAQIAWRLVSPALRIRELQFRGCEVSDFAASSWVLRPGEPWSLWGKVRFLSDASDPTIEIRGWWEDGEEILSIPLDFRSAVEGEETLVLWGHARIRELQGLRDCAPSDERRNTYRQRIQAVSLESGVLSSETAFVGVLPRSKQRLFPGSMRSVNVAYRLSCDDHTWKHTARAGRERSASSNVQGRSREVLSLKDVARALLPPPPWFKTYAQGSPERKLAEEFVRIWNEVGGSFESLASGGSIPSLLGQVEAAQCRHLQAIGLALILMILVTGGEKGMLQLDSNELQRLKQICFRVAAQLDRLRSSDFTPEPRRRRNSPLPGLSAEGAEFLRVLANRLNSQPTQGPRASELSAQWQLLKTRMQEVLEEILESL